MIIVRLDLVPVLGNNASGELDSKGLTALLTEALRVLLNNGFASPKDF
ncbi:MAG: hypothetical protein WEG40_18080 [Candidatus Rokuibacteriota bacterium]